METTQPHGFPDEQVLEPRGGRIRRGALHRTDRPGLPAYVDARAQSHQSAVARQIVGQTRDDVKYREYLAKLRNYTDTRFGVTI